jgi:DNA-binding protein HU-beta
MQKTELIAAVAKSTGLTQVDAGKAVNAAIEAITGALKSGDKVTLTGFGTFQVRKTAARTGVNPRTRQKINIAAGKRATFSAGSELKGSVSGKAAPRKANGKKPAAGGSASGGMKKR